jgi:hypothetical protein
MRFSCKFNENLGKSVSMMTNLSKKTVPSLPKSNATMGLSSVWNSKMAMQTL